MTILETITGMTLLVLALVASSLFFEKMDCHHQLMVQGVELRLRPLEHDSKTMVSTSRKCKAHLNRSQNQISIRQDKDEFQLNLPLKGQL